MDIERFIIAIGNYPQEIFDELVMLSKEILTNLLTDLEADKSCWRFDRTMLQASIDIEIDIYDVWNTYKGLLIAALNHSLDETDELQQQVNKIMEAMPYERDTDA